MPDAELGDGGIVRNINMPSIETYTTIPFACVKCVTQSRCSIRATVEISTFSRISSVVDDFPHIAKSPERAESCIFGTCVHTNECCNWPPLIHM